MRDRAIRTTMIATPRIPPLKMILNKLSSATGLLCAGGAFGGCATAGLYVDNPKTIALSVKLKAGIMGVIRSDEKYQLDLIMDGFVVAKRIKG